MNTNRNVIYGSRPVQVRLKPELHAWIHARAAEEERSANWIINKVLEDAANSAQAKAEARQ